MQKRFWDLVTGSIGFRVGFRGYGSVHIAHLILDLSTPLPVSGFGYGIWFSLFKMWQYSGLYDLGCEELGLRDSLSV